MEQKIDLKDRKILYELDLNSRASFQSIAKKVGLSKNAVIYRFNALKKEGVIKNCRARIDLGKLGYMEFRIYLNLKNANPKKEQEILDFLCKNKYVTWVGHMDGQYNVGAKVVTKNIHEMHELWDELFGKYVNYIEERLMTVIAGSNYYYKAYLINAKQSEKKESVTSAMEVEKLEDIDFAIIKNLVKDSRMPIIDVAEKLKITPKTVIAHIKSLEKKKVILGYESLFDLTKIGYQTFRISFILHKVTDERMDDFQKYAMNNPALVWDEEVIGGDDYEIEVQVEDIGKLREVIQEIKTKFVDIIQDYKILHIFEENKHLSFPEIN